MLGAVALASSAMANPDPPSWSAFDPASFEEIYVTPELALDGLNYIISLGAHPKITLGGTTYNVNGIQAFFVVSQDQETGFIATNGTGNDWKWEDKTQNGRIAGWLGEGGLRVHANESKLFHYGTFDPTGNDVLSGFHVAYQSGSTEITGWYKDDAPPVPEPSSLIALLTGCIGCGYLLRKRTS